MKTKRNQWAIWICNHCEEEYPYEPAVCNDCGTVFVANKSFTYAADFNFVEPTRERVVPISTREQAMAWWNAKSFEQKWFTVVKYKKMIVGYPDREPTTLTGREIEAIWTMEQTDQTTTDLTFP